MLYTSFKNILHTYKIRNINISACKIENIKVNGK